MLSATTSRNRSQTDEPLQCLANKRQKLADGERKEMVITSAQKRRIERNRLQALEKRKPKTIYVVDLETTSFPPAPSGAEHGDVILEIAIVECERSKPDGSYSIKPVLQCFINPESYKKYPSNWKDKDAWIFQHGMSAQMVKKYGFDCNVIIPQIRRILNGQFVTSYNTAFDIHKFLHKAPYSVKCKPFKCIHKLCNEQMNDQRPSLAAAAYHYLGWDHKRFHSAHNAYEDTMTAARIMVEILRQKTVT